MTQTKIWIREIFKIFNMNKNNSLLIGYFYLFTFLVLPSIPLLQFFSPLIIILWPIVVVQIVMFFNAKVKVEEFRWLSINSKIRARVPQLIRIGLITFLYALIVSTLLSKQMQSLVEQANSVENNINISAFKNVFMKLFLLMIPLFAATWFSPMISVFRKESVFKAIKSSLAGIILYIGPLFFTWIILLFGFGVSIYFIQTIIGFLSFSQSAFSVISTILIFSMTAIYVSLLFIFQYVSYRDIFKL